MHVVFIIIVLQCKAHNIIKEKDCKIDE